MRKSRSIRNLGAEFRLGKRLGRDFTLDDLRRDFDARVPGDRRPGLARPGLPRRRVGHACSGFSRKAYRWPAA